MYSYSMVLTKGFLMHRRYTGIYSCLAPRPMLAFVDEHKNGEDIAMNFVVSSLTGLQC